MVLGGLKRVRATPLPVPKPIAQSITVQAWRLRTSDGQTMYVTKVEHLRDNRTSHILEPTPPTAPKQASANEAVESARASKNALYVEFCRQLQGHLESWAMRPKEIENALDLVPSQVNKWLSQAEQDGRIRRISKKPAKFALCCQKSL